MASCQLVAQPTRPEPIKRTEFPNAPWQHLACDLLGPLPSDDYILAVVDTADISSLNSQRARRPSRLH